MSIDPRAWNGIRNGAGSAQLGRDDRPETATGVSADRKARALKKLKSTKKNQEERR